MREAEALRRVGVPRRFWGSTIEGINEHVRGIVMEYIEQINVNASNGKGMVILGTVGTGKTSILAVIAKEIARIVDIPDYAFNDEIVRKIRFVTADDIFNFAHSRDEKEIQAAKAVKLLLLDDFGRGYPSDYGVAVLDSVLNYRYSQKKPTIITTNLSPKDMQSAEIKQRYFRIVDRMRDSSAFERIAITGESRRR